MRLLKRFPDYAAILPVVLCGLAGLALAAGAPTLYQSVQSAIDGHIIPAFARFTTASDRLANATEALCQAPSPGARRAVDASFRETVLSWAGVAYLRFGPLARTGRSERISFWPDPRGVRERQMRPILAARDVSILAPGMISKQSAALQGLPALESLLTDRTIKIEGTGEDSRFRCQLASAVAQNIAALARDMAAEWSAPGGWRDQMLRPGSDNDTYKEPAEAASEIMKSFLTGLQIIAEQQIRPRVLAETSQGKAFAGPFEKSGLRDSYYEASIAALADLYSQARFSEFLPAEDTATKLWIDQAFDKLSQHGENQQTGAAAPSNLNEILDGLTRLRRSAADKVAPAAGLTIGFNDLDGD